MRTPPIWRLVRDGDLPGALNMARDVAVLEAVSAGKAPPTLRLYGWDPPCLTLGRHQGVDAADLEFCRREDIDVVRRPTGGRALLHHHELTYAFVAPLGRGPMPRSLQDAYRLICSALVTAVRSLGVGAELTSGDVNLELPGPRTTVPCFEAPAGGEVVVNGRKLVGSAMRAHSGSILQHGAIVLDWDGRLQAGTMGLADDSGLRPHITTLSDEIGRSPDVEDLGDRVVRGFADVFATSFEAGSLTPGEEARARELRTSFVVSG